VVLAQASISVRLAPQAPASLSAEEQRPVAARPAAARPAPSAESELIKVTVIRFPCGYRPPCRTNLRVVADMLLQILHQDFDFRERHARAAGDMHEHVRASDNKRPRSIADSSRPA
jgi:hypothetical protein